MFCLITRTAIQSAVYAVIETLWYFYFTGLLFTTKEQFLLNLVFLPFLNFGITYLVRGTNVVSWPVLNLILLFPWIVWIYELFGGYALMLVTGTNRAWHYPGQPFHGNVNFQCYLRWVGLGVLYVLFVAFIETKYGYCAHSLFAA